MTLIKKSAENAHKNEESGPLYVFSAQKILPRAGTLEATQHIKNGGGAFSEEVRFLREQSCFYYVKSRTHYPETSGVGVWPGGEGR